MNDICRIIIHGQEVAYYNDEVKATCMYQRRFNHPLWTERGMFVLKNNHQLQVM